MNDPYCSELHLVWIKCFKNLDLFYFVLIDLINVVPRCALRAKYVNFRVILRWSLLIHSNRQIDLVVQSELRAWSAIGRHMLLVDRVLKLNDLDKLTSLYNCFSRVYFKLFHCFIIRYIIINLILKQSCSLLLRKGHGQAKLQMHIDIWFILNFVIVSATLTRRVTQQELFNSWLPVFLWISLFFSFYLLLFCWTGISCS